MDDTGPMSQADPRREGPALVDRRMFMAGAATAGAVAMLGMSALTATASGPVVGTRKPARPMIGYVLSHEQFPL